MLDFIGLAVLGILAMIVTVNVAGGLLFIIVVIYEGVKEWIRRRKAISAVDSAVLSMRSKRKS